MRIKQSHSGMHCQWPGAQLPVIATYQLLISYSCPWLPFLAQNSWLGWKPSSVAPHSSAGSGDPPGTGAVVAGSSEDVPTDAATGES